MDNREIEMNILEEMKLLQAVRDKYRLYKYLKQIRGVLEMLVKKIERLEREKDGVNRDSK